MGYFSDLRGSQFKTFVDISANKEDLIAELNVLKAKTSLSTEEQARYNTIVAELSNSVISATDINKIQNSIENLEVFLENQPLYYRGEYNPQITYNRGDVVHYEGSAYVCIINNTINYLPTNTNKWKIFVKQGTSAQLVGQRNTVKVNESVNTVNIGIEDYEKGRDYLMVHKNGLYLNQGTDYMVSADGKSITNITGTAWQGAEDYDLVFDFCALKQAYGCDFKPNETVVISGGNSAKFRG